MALEKTRRAIRYRSRDCDVCGGARLRLLWEYSYDAHTRHHVFHWKVRIVLCEECGFVFTSPAPEDESLEEYYGDSLAHRAEGILDFSIDRRMDLLERYSAGGGKAEYIEVGSNRCTAFLARLREHFADVKTVELNDECAADHASLSELPVGCADVVASYFVLEHVPRPAEFLRACRRLMAPGGVCIVEVPTVELYPLHPESLALWEHTNHFTPATLTGLAAVNGLELVEVEQDTCSRNFGIAAVFRAASVRDRAPPSSEVESNAALIKEGLEAHRRFEDRLTAVRKALAEAQDAGEVAVIWAANEFLRRLIDGGPLPADTLLVDIDPRKRDFFSPLRVHLPQDQIPALERCRLLVINSRPNAEAIQEWIRVNTDNDLTGTDLILL